MYGVGVLYSRLGKTAVNSVQEGTKLVCRKTLIIHINKGNTYGRQGKALKRSKMMKVYLASNGSS